MMRWEKKGGDQPVTTRRNGGNHTVGVFFSILDGNDGGVKENKKGHLGVDRAPHLNIILSNTTSNTVPLLFAYFGGTSKEERFKAPFRWQPLAHFFTAGEKNDPFSSRKERGPPLTPPSRPL